MMRMRGTFIVTVLVASLPSARAQSTYDPAGDLTDLATTCRDAGQQYQGLEAGLAQLFGIDAIDTGLTDRSVCADCITMGCEQIEKRLFPDLKRRGTDFPLGIDLPTQAEAARFTAFWSICNEMWHCVCGYAPSESSNSGSGGGGDESLGGRLSGSNQSGGGSSYRSLPSSPQPPITCANFFRFPRPKPIPTVPEEGR